MRRALFVAFLLGCSLACFAQEGTVASPRANDLVPTSFGQHRFFDKANLALHGWNLAAETYDAITTRRGARPIHELNPFGALFVNHGLVGQAVFSYGLGTGGPLLTSYLLHRT